MQSVPEIITRLLKSYDLDLMDWNQEDDRYIIVIEIITKGGNEEKAWLSSRLSFDEIRSLVLSRKGQSLDEEQRQKIRVYFGITTDDFQKRNFIRWR